MNLPHAWYAMLLLAGAVSLLIVLLRDALQQYRRRGLMKPAAASEAAEAEDYLLYDRHQRSFSERDD